ncbi:MAG TPA: efflux RND transporter periplasmic adaptor subunit [Spirochaetales bacterium]|nr:efflux RND transporter periplasmic adaptor subunit [Spirochaetales bacterium]
MKAKRSSRRALIITLSAAALFALVAALVLLRLAKDPDAAAYTKVRVSSFVDRTVIESSGNIQALRSSDLSFHGAGLVESVAAVEGLVVSKGRVLATMDDSSEAYNLANAEYKLEQARLSGNARSAQLALLDVDLKKADLERKRLAAPFAGVITGVDVEVGEYVSGGATVMSLIDRSSLKAVLQIDEIDLPKVRAAQIVEFEFDAIPGVTYRGAVSRIPPVGRVTSQGLAVFDVEATIENPPAELLPGYSFSATILVSEAKAVLTVPSAAVFAAPRGAELAGGEDASADGEAAGPAAGDAAGLPADPSARRAAFASMSEEQRAALRAQFAASGGGAGAGLGLRGAGTGAIGTDPAAGAGAKAASLAVYVPGEDDEPVLRLIAGIARSDGTVEIVSGLEAGEWVLVPKSGSAASSGAAAASGSNPLLPNMRFITGGGGGAPSGAPPSGGRP